MNHMDDILDETPVAEQAANKEFAQVAPGARKSYEEIDADLGARHGYGEQAAKEHAKEALEELYASEFPIDDPPESFERYEAELAVRHMRESVNGMFLPAKHDDGEDEDDGAAEFVDDAMSIIDVMATYGGLAEPHIAALTGGAIPPEVREHAIETLGELRDDSDGPQSLREAIGRWLLGRE